MRTGALIVYTSADSVFQIAAHEESSIPELYCACEIAYELVGEGSAWDGSSRRSSGHAGAVQADGHRRDFALPPLSL